MAAALNTGMSNTKLRALLSGHEKLLVEDRETDDLAPGVATVRSELKTTSRDLEDAVEEAAGLEYVAIAKDKALDLDTKGFSDAMYNACGRKRSVLRFVSAFPKGQTHITQPRLWDQLERIDEYIPPWTTLAETDELVAEWLPRIKSGRDALSSALSNLDNGVSRINTAKWNEQRARMKAVALWDSDAGELLTRFAGNRSRGESFFPAVRESSSSQTGDEGTVQPPTPPVVEAPVSPTSAPTDEETPT